MSGRKIVGLFNSVGVRDIYHSAMPDGMSRNSYASDRMNKINDSKKLKDLLEIVFSARHFNEADKDIELAVVETNKILKDEGFEFIKDQSGNFKIASSDPKDEAISSEIHFEEIEGQLIAELKKAKYCIWAAVAWFTNQKLYNLLVEKARDGLSVQILILDDDINRNCGLHDTPKIHTLKAQPQGQFKNIIHNKFCIVDLKTVIHGSYNWTNKANYNNETLDIETRRENAEKGADEFMKLKAEVRKAMQKING